MDREGVMPDNEFPIMWYVMIFIGFLAITAPLFLAACAVYSKFKFDNYGQLFNKKTLRMGLFLLGLVASGLATMFIFQNTPAFLLGPFVVISFCFILK